MAWLIRREGVVPVLVEGEITIGRASYSNIWLDDSAVSRTHCRLAVDKGQLVLRDASSNGTFVNGARIGSSAHLSHGDTIQVAGHTLSVQQTPLPPVRPVVSIPPPDAAPPIVPEVQITSLANGEGPVAVPTSNVVESSFHVQVVEDLAAPTAALRYRDAVRLVDGSALVLMTDIMGEPALPPEAIAQWKTAVRAAGSRGLGPDAVLQVLNTEMFAAGLQATACCGWLDPRERLLAISCAGMPPPWIIRSSRKVIRVQATASVGLGTVKSAQWSARTLHFERGDTLLLPSTAWSTALEQTLEGNLPDMSRLPAWLRGHPAQPPRSSAICLTMT